MAKSINRSQAAALADGFLEGIGSEQGSFEPKECYTEIILLAGELVEDAQNNLNATNSNASGSLSSSLEIQDPEQTGNILRTDITMLIYGRYVNKGVKGVQSGSGLYSFKNLDVSESFISSLEKSISKSGSKVSSTNTSKTISQVEKKNASISSLEKSISKSGSKVSSTNTSKTISQVEKKNASISATSKAWGAAINIKKFGIKATGFIDKAVVSTQSKVQERLGKALKVDIINSMDKI